MKRTMVGTVIAAFTLAGIVAVAPASAAPAATQGAVGPAHASCGTPGPNLENRVEADAPSGGAANQRSGTRAVSPTDCVIVGVLQPSDDAVYYCWTRGQDGFTWTYLRNLRTGVSGWVRDNLLDGNGSNVGCGF
jgi:hypothetical protein